MAKKPAAKRVRIKGANEADKANIKLAREANKRAEPVKVVQRGEDTPEATPKEARQAVEKQFQKADEAGKAEMIADNQRSIAVRGY